MILISSAEEVIKLADLINQFGAINFLLAVLSFASIMSIPVIIGWLKDIKKNRRDEKYYQELEKIYNKIENQYSDNLKTSLIEYIIYVLTQSISYQLKFIGYKIIIRNNLKEKINIKNKISCYVEIIYAESMYFFNKIRYKNVTASNFINKLWFNNIEQMIYEIIISDLLEENKLESLELKIETETENLKFFLIKAKNEINNH